MIDIGFEAIRRLKELEQPLTAAIEKHLPGNFSSWEAENSTWDGEIKNVRNSHKNPHTTSCCWKLIVAAEQPELTLGYIPALANSETLDQAEAAMSEVMAALGRLSPIILIRLDNAWARQLRNSYEDASKSPGSPYFTLRLLADAMQDGLVNARDEIQKFGDRYTKANLEAAAVVQTCREVFELRTGKTAPTTGLANPQKKSDHREPALFIRFAEEVFAVFGIKDQVPSSLKRLKLLHDKREKSTPKSK